MAFHVADADLIILRGADVIVWGADVIVWGAYVPPDVALEMACRARARGGSRDARRRRGRAEPRVLVRGQAARLWCLQTGACLSALVGARAAMETVCFSPCGAYLALGAADGSLSVWRDVAREPPGRRRAGGRRRRDVGTDDETSIEARIEARLDAGMRVLLAPHDPDAECARERDAGTPVDAAAVAGARGRRWKTRSDSSLAWTPKPPLSWGNWRARARAGWIR